MESSLNVQFRNLQGDIGHYLGYGRGADNGDQEWDDLQKADVRRCTEGGLRKFYFCGIDWSFLRPTKTLTLSEGENSLALPDDFGGIEGRIFVLSDSVTSRVIEVVNPGIVDSWYARYDSSTTITGPPQMVAIRPLRGTTIARSNRADLYFYPTADGSYSIKFQYYLLPDYLSGAQPYAYGGVEHAETLLEACLAAAELVKDGKVAEHAAEFQRLLAISQAVDRRKKSQTLGYNGDRSDLTNDSRVRNFAQFPTVTIDGVTPEA